MIDYQILADSVKFYESKGFQRIEAPWTVTQAISNITKPKEIADFTIQEKDKVLVASGEQSLLYLYNKGFLPKGKFQTITPCFRDELFDLYHTKYFIKNELIVTDDVCQLELRKMILTAKMFFEKYCLREKPNDSCLTLGIDEVNIFRTTNGKRTVITDFSKDNDYKFHTYDLEYRDIELGSYGIRKCAFLEWIYGTGVAEPRLSKVLQTWGITKQYKCVKE